MARFQYDCVSPADELELEYIIDNMAEISHDIFMANAEEEALGELLGRMGYSEEFPIAKDYAVRYYSCFLPTKQCTAYIMVQSAIEYVFYDK